MHVSGFLLSDRETAWAAVVFRSYAAERLRLYGSVSPEVLQLRDSLAAATRRTTSVLVTDAPGHAASSVAAGVAASGPHEMTVQAASGALRVSQRTVRRLCESGALPAVKAADGHWRIDAAAAAAMAARPKGA